MPKSVTALGGKYIFPTDARETPDVMTALYDYGDFQMSWEHNLATSVGLYGMQHGIAFIGANGTLLLNRSGWEVRPDKVKDVPKMEAVAWQAQSDTHCTSEIFSIEVMLLQPWPLQPIRPTRITSEGETLFLIEARTSIGTAATTLEPKTIRAVLRRKKRRFIQQVFL